MITRMIAAFRTNFTDYLQDIWIYSDFQKLKKTGSEGSSGYGLEVYAETKNGNVINIDSLYNSSLSVEENLPETIGENAAKRLIDEMMFVRF